ncbi:MAG: phage tail tape measure protein [Bacteroidia bacterium]|nr:phage tail tape measure protein [Bacteroidia bacterium]
MAKNTQEAEVIVTLNGEPAKRVLDELEKEYKDLEKAALAAYKAGDEALGKKLENQAQKVRKSFEVAKVEAKKFDEIIKNINSATLKELNNVSKQLRNELNRLAPGTQAFIDKTKQLQQVNARIGMLKQGFRGVVEEQKKLSLKSLSDGFNRYFGIVTAGIGAVTGLSVAFRKAAQAAAELDDTYADVMKTTGLTHDEVKALDAELMKLDTRTSREKLLQLARDAGKLGITGTQNVLDFVAAADKINVALGEDLGEGAIRNLGKISDVFGLTDALGTGDALTKVGSAINAVGQASTANEAYLVQFTQRLAGAMAQAKISVADTIGFASAFDQSGMAVEMASTALQQFITKMFTNTATFAKYAKMEVGDFTRLLETDANKAIVTVMKSLNQSGGFAEMIGMFKDMGADGVRAVSALSAVAQNIDAVTEAQALANVEFEKGTSLQQEFDTKNNNLQAQLEKARKEFHNATIALGQSLNPALLKSTNGLTYMIRALSTYGREIRNALIAVAALTVAVKAHAIAHGIANAVVKTGAALRATGTVVVNASRLAYAKLTGATAAATAAQTALNTAMSASVFGMIALAVTGVTVAITRWVKNSREARAEAQYMEDINKRIADSYSSEAGRVTALSNIIHNNSLAIDTRRRALAELNKLVPGYHASLTEEGKLIDDNTEALDAYLKKLEMTTRSKILEEEYTGATSEVLQAEKLLEQARQAADEALVKAGGDNRETVTKTVPMTFDGQQFEQTLTYTTEYGRAMEEVYKKTVELTKAQEKQAAIMSRIGKEEVWGAGAGGVDDAATGKPAAADISGIEAANEILTQAQFKLLQERYRKLTKSEKNLVDKGYAALTEEESRTLKDRYDRFVEADKRLADKRYNDAVKALDNQQRAEQNEAKRGYLTGELSAEQYEQRLLQIKDETLAKKLELAKKEGRDTSSIEQQILDQQIGANKAAYDRQLKELEREQKNEEYILLMSRAGRLITEEEFESRTLQLKMLYLQKRLDLVRASGIDETAALQAIFDAQTEAQELANSKLDKMREEAGAVKEKLDPDSTQAQNLQSELDRLEELHAAKLLSEEEYEKAVAQLQEEYAQESLKKKLEKASGYIQQVQGVLNAASDFTSALQSAETAQLEAEYQARLAAAGDNAEEREAIEAEYEQKKLDTQKKYADVDMVINIAKTIASGALAAVQCFAQLGPVAGAVMAAVIAGTTAAEIATIVAQRNAIKNASVSGGGSAQKTGVRTVTGFAEGGYTAAAQSDSKPVGVVHANEWVAPAWMVREDPVRFADLERYRRTRQRSRAGEPGGGFAAGGYTGGGAAQNSTTDAKTIGEAVARAVGDTLTKNPLRSYVVRNDIRELDKQDERFKKQTSR